MKGRNGFAVILILVGIFILLNNTGLFSDNLVLFVVSLGFFIAYFLPLSSGRKGNVGFLIPASITLAVGIFTVLEENFLIESVKASVFFLLLGSAFFMIYFIHFLSMKYIGFRRQTWAAITGTVLYGLGTLIFLMEYFDFSFARIILQNLWPVGLILAGAIIIFRNFTGSHKKQ